VLVQTALARVAEEARPSPPAAVVQEVTAPPTSTPLKLNIPAPPSALITSDVPPIVFVVSESNVQRIEREAREARQKALQRPRTRLSFFRGPFAVRTIARDWRQCVGYARAASPKPVPRVFFARQIRPTASTPAVGSWILLAESWRGHVAVVTGYDAHNIYIEEANYRRGFRTTRTLPRNYVAIRGFVI